jgi:hypothetical protein
MVEPKRKELILLVNAVFQDYRFIQKYQYRLLHP